MVSPAFKLILQGTCIFNTWLNNILYLIVDCACQLIGSLLSEPAISGLCVPISRISKWVLVNFPLLISVSTSGSSTSLPKDFTNSVNSNGFSTSSNVLGLK